MDQCFNHRNLKGCARYVLTTAPKSANHKPVCDHNVAQLAQIDAQEQSMERHLRHWVMRFDASLHVACIRGLNLKYEWERIGQGGLVIFMEPRPHPNVGSRWRIQNAGMFKNEFIDSVLDQVGMLDQYREQVLPMHIEARERLQKSSGGTSDYASVFIIATNIGSDALEGDPPPIFRFRDGGVHADGAAIGDRRCGHSLPASLEDGQLAFMRIVNEFMNPSRILPIAAIEIPGQTCVDGLENP
ncbi:hypothetical protein B0H14DRAFT_3140626 [Mycena olivaceomarginata]|nr:hypothetical protein B0H14DRAFT_3140626 [Mycena olivaceomarginata]